MDPEEVREQLKQIKWWHQIDLGNGIITPGPDNTIKRISEMGLPEDLTGKSVLDIGAWDGAFSFEAERRGARRVLAIDEFVWAGKGWASKAGFDFARRVLDSKVEDMLLDVYDLSPDRIGRFDLVLFAGVLYHLRHPLLALEKVASVTADQLILCTHIDLIQVKRPAMAFYPGNELNNDITNWWGPNLPALEAMLKSVGFGDVITIECSPQNSTSVEEIFSGWATVHAWKYLTEISFCQIKPANARIEGFYDTEPWGTWSHDSRVAITLDRPVAGKVIFSLTGRAHGPNIGRQVGFEIGNARSTFVFSAEPGTVEIPLDLDAPANRITIDGLTPVSPASITGSADTRHIAIELTSLTVKRQRVAT